MKFLLLFSLFFIFGCGGKKSVKTKFNLTLSASTSQSSPGGIIVIGKSNSTGTTFQESVNYSSFSKDLDVGSWNFVAFSWNGSTPFSGALRCSNIVSINIGQVSLDINLNLTEGNCLTVSSFFDSGGINSYSSPSVPYPISFKVCNHDEGQGVLDSGHCSYSGLATGLILSSASSANGINSSFPLSTGCFKLNNGIHYSSYIIPMASALFRLMNWKIKLYYSSFGPSCAGTSCCQGRVKEMIFAKGFGGGSHIGTLSSSYSSYSNTFLFNEPKIEKELKFSSLASVSYTGCNPVQVDFYENGSPNLSPSAFSFTPHCSTSCSFYSDSSCSSSVSEVSFPASTSSKTFYMKVNSPESFSLSQGGDDISIGGDLLLNIGVDALYSDIDSHFVNAPSSLTSVGTTSLSLSNISSGVYGVYQTLNGNRGKLYINSITNIATNTDRMDFDFITWDSSGNIVAQGTNITSDQCFSSGDCFLDFDINEGKLSPSNVPGESEVWWGGAEGIQQFSVQGGAPFRYIGP